MLHDWFGGSVRRYPTATALVVAGQELTYAELDDLSLSVKHDLLAAGAARPRVGLLATRSALAYAAYLAVLRAGGVVVPLDAAHPAPRLASIARAAGLDFVIADQGQDTAFADGGPARLPAAGTSQPSTQGTGREAEPDWPGSPADGAYLLFTSGSTGRPKGVPISHGNLDDFLRFNIGRYQVGPGCRLSQTFHLTFDPSVFDMFVAWGSGATLVVPSVDDLYDPAAFVNQQAITHWYSVPSLIAIAADAGTLRPGSMPSLRWSLFCGEQFPLAHARSWADAAPGSVIENLYGPTELTVTVAAYRLPGDRARWPATVNGTVPIGQVYPHLEHRVSEDGELLVRGSQRFAGYHDPADDAGRFAGRARDPAAWYRTGDRVALHDGALVHLGRVDRQIKFRGHRIELSEIEGALRTWAGVEDAVVFPVARAGTTELAAVCAGQASPTLPELRARLRQHLPLHMIPRHVVHVERLPLNDRGKVDRHACSALLEPS